jgi:hypothetical protein
VVTSIDKIGYMDIMKKKTCIFFEPLSVVIDYQLANVQRLLDMGHVNKLVEDQITEMSEHGQFSMLQSITCVDLDNKRYVLDGQHRIEAFKILKSQGYVLDTNIPIICYNVSTVDELRHYYVRINKHHPINPFEVSDEWLKDGKQFFIWFSREFKSYIKDNGQKKCNCPNINIRDLMTYINKYNVFKRIPGNMELIDFTNHITNLNHYLHSHHTQISNYQIQSDFTLRIGRCIKKNPNNPCFLGIWRKFEWVEMVIYAMETNTKFKDVSFSKFALNRPMIGKQKRIDVWKKRNGQNMVGHCYVCNEDMGFENMECGHIVSFFHGGGCELSNLEPICKTCNRDMGILNLNDYKNVIS